MAATAVDADEDAYLFAVEPNEFWSFALIRGWVMYLPGLSNTGFRLYCKLRSMIVHGSPRTLRRMTVDQICWLMTNPGEKAVSKSAAKNALRELRSLGLIEDLDGDPQRETSRARRYRVCELPDKAHLGVRNSWDWLDAYTKDWRETGGQNSAPLTNPDNPLGVKPDISAHPKGEGVRKLTPGGQNSDRGGQNSVDDGPLTSGNATPYEALPDMPLLPCSSSSSPPLVGEPGEGKLFDAAAPPREDEEETMTTTLASPSALSNEGTMAMDGTNGADWRREDGLPEHLAETGEAYFKGMAVLDRTQYRPDRAPTVTVEAPQAERFPRQTRREVQAAPPEAMGAPVRPVQLSEGAAERLGALWQRERAGYGFGTTRAVQSRIVSESKAHLAAGEKEEILAAALRNMASRRTWLSLDRHMEHFVPATAGHPDLSAEQLRAVAAMRALAADDGSVSWQRLEEWRGDNIALLHACGWVGDDWDTGLTKAGIVWVQGKGNMLVDLD